MAIDKAQLTEYINELGLSDAVRASMLAEMEADEQRATRFVGQRLRHADYTKKTQELATTKQTLEAQVQQQLNGYAREVADANAKIVQIAQDLQNEKISKATAEARLQKVKTTYALSDDDIPAIEEVRVTPNAAPPMDVKAMMEEFKTNIIKEIRTDLAAMPNVTASQVDIAEQHRELFGRRMSREEMTEITALAQKNGTNLTRAWEDKHGVNDIRITNRVNAEVTAKLKEAEDARRAAADAAALSQVTSNREPTSYTAHSSVLGRKFDTHVDPTTSTDPARTAPPISPVPTQTGQRLSGAERAAAAWITKANAGMVGKPMPVQA